MPARLRRPRRCLARPSPGTGLACGLVPFQSPGLEWATLQQAIRSATAILARKAPGQVAGFREFLTEIAVVVAEANNEGGFFGLGARRRTPHEAAALEAVRRAAEIES